MFRVISLHTISLLESKYTSQSKIDVKNSDEATTAAHGSNIANNEKMNYEIVYYLHAKQT